MRRVYKELSFWTSSKSFQSSDKGTTRKFNTRDSHITSAMISKIPSIRGIFTFIADVMWLVLNFQGFLQVTKENLRDDDQGSLAGVGPFGLLRLDYP